jgi:hypothetical protein
MAQLLALVFEAIPTSQRPKRNHRSAYALYGRPRPIPLLALVVPGLEEAVGPRYVYGFIFASHVTVVKLIDEPSIVIIDRVCSLRRSSECRPPLLY